MKRKLSVLVLGILGLLTLLPSCGADEGTGGDDDGSGGGGETPCTNDQQCDGGRVCSDNGSGDHDGFCEAGETCQCVKRGSGTGGASSTGGASGTGGGIIGGTGGTGGGSVTSALGEPCAADDDCGTGLVCLLPNGLPSGDGPPNGMCTLRCTADDNCLEFANDAYCVGFEKDANMQNVSYCVLACTGTQAGSPKCRERDDFACGILDATPTTVACATTDDCAVHQVCFEDVCQDMIEACLPTCRADSDCADAQFCDFATGFCTGTEPDGLPLGALCDPSLPAAQDECNGFCSATDATETEGTCTAFCSASPDAYGCGWVGDGAPDNACLYATIISRDASGQIDLAISDLMICGSLCDCNDDCPAEAEFCMDESAGDPMNSIQARFGRAGYCRPLNDQRMETEADSIATCP
jgi:hypothetical protein